MPKLSLRLDKLGRWVPSLKPLRIDPPRIPLQVPPLRPPPFETLATVPVSTSLQASQAFPGPRLEEPKAGMVVMELGEAVQKARKVRGIELPIKPSPPKEGECCMSGCAHCVYDVFVDSLETYHDIVKSARSELLSLDPPINSIDWPAEELGEMEIESGNSKEIAERELKARLKDLDPSTRAFLEFEAKLKQKRKERKLAAEEILREMAL